MPITFFCEGGRQGNDFFFSIVASDSNGPRWEDRTQLVGRNEGKTYQVAGKLVSVGVSNSENAVDSSGGVFAAYVGQFLNMGVPDFDLQKIEWHGTELTAIAPSGNEVLGELSLSNDVPVKLSLRLKGRVKPFRIISYVFPVLATQLGGFPERMTISSPVEGEMKAILELALLEVKTAPAGLPNDFFSVARLATTNIQLTNFYSNNVLFVRNTNGVLVKPRQPAHVAMHGQTPKSDRLGVYILFTVLSLGAAALYLKLQKTTSKKG